jgi:glyoxylase-like metal-dependent hydrolase (beta-lactamase superfamily II)
MGPTIEALHDPQTGSVSYLVVDPRSQRCAVIDCWLGLNVSTGRIDRTCVAHWCHRIEHLELQLEWILETHVHADHLSGAFALRAAAGGRIGIGAGVLDVARQWQSIFAPSDDAQSAPHFDRLFADGETLALGAHLMRVLATPGHSPSCVTYVIEDAAFVGDTLFMPQAGTARCDFPGGSARVLYRSIRRILELPPSTRLHCAHDYGDPARWQSTVQTQRRENVQVHAGVTEEEFVALRERRDRSLAPPVLLYPALQVNLRAGELPAKEANGVAYLKLPLDVARAFSVEREQ